MKKILITALCMSIATGASALNARNQESGQTHSDELLPLHRTVTMAKKEQKKCRLSEQKFITRIGDELINISEGCTTAYEQVRDYLVLIKDILQNKDISKKVRIALFEVVEEQIRMLVKMEEQIMEGHMDLPVETRSLMNQSRCSSPSSGASQADVELNANMSATPNELNEVLFGLSALKENVKKVQNVKTALSVGYAVGVPLAVSVLAGLGFWLMHDKLCSRTPYAPDGTFIIRPDHPSYNYVAQTLQRHNPHLPFGVSPNSMPGNYPNMAGSTGVGHPYSNINNSGGVSGFQNGSK